MSHSGATGGGGYNFVSLVAEITRFGPVDGPWENRLAECGVAVSGSWKRSCECLFERHGSRLEGPEEKRETRPFSGLSETDLKAHVKVESTSLQRSERRQRTGWDTRRRKTAHHFPNQVWLASWARLPPRVPRYDEREAPPTESNSQPETRDRPRRRAFIHDAKWLNVATRGVNWDEARLAMDGPKTARNPPARPPAALHPPVTLLDHSAGTSVATDVVGFKLEGEPASLFHRRPSRWGQPSVGEGCAMAR